jgi:tRNA (guanine-N7-)-methyltransferase
VGDAYVLLNVCFEEASLESVTVNFPDPWPKARHARRRLFTEEFFGTAARKLAPAGRLFLATDDASYARQAVEQATLVPELASEHPGTPWLSESPYPNRTRYEKKWIEEGRSLHYLIYRRKERTCHGDTESTEEHSDCL